MEAIETIAMWVAVAASSFALALLMQWALLLALFHVMPRRARGQTAVQASSIAQQLHPATSRAA
jgi:hypothetical protein